LSRHPRLELLRSTFLALTPLVVLAFLPATSCTYERSPHLPTTSPLTIERLDPKPAQRNIALDHAIRLHFAVPPDASSVNAGTLRLFSGRSETLGKLSIDLLERTVSLEPFSNLRPSLRYQVRIINGIRSLDGRSLSDAMTYEFTTGEAIDGKPAPPPALTLAQLQPIWDAHCVSCHSTQPAAGLDLGRPERARATLVNVPSIETQWRLVSPGSHAKSYLIHKIIEDSGISGLRMPPGGSPLDAADLRRIADWIDGGAL
jgi:hypothetical protein